MWADWPDRIHLSPLVRRVTCAPRDWRLLEGGLGLGLRSRTVEAEQADWLWGSAFGASLLAWCEDGLDIKGICAFRIE